MSRIMYPKDLPAYRWPNMSLLDRQYVVRDDLGRVGIGYSNARLEGDLWAYPIEMQVRMAAGDLPGTEMLPGNSIIMTQTHWTADDDGWHGIWCGYLGPVGCQIPGDQIRHLIITEDLGWVMPDKWADEALAGSDKVGFWDYGAKLGKIGGEPPVKGQRSGEMTVGQAEEYTREVGEPVSARGIRLACARGDIFGARKVGRDWLMTYDAVNHYLDNRPRPGRK